MRVVHLIIGGERAGGQRVAQTLAEGAMQRGHDVHVVSPTPGPIVDELRTAGIAVHLIDIGRIFRLGAARELRHLLVRIDADLLHTHVMVAANALARTTARSAHVPVISHMHGHNVFRANRIAGGAYRTLDNATSRLCARLIAVSDDTRSRLIEQGIRPESVVTVHNGLDPLAHVPAPAAVSQLAGRRIVCCIGRIEPMKGQADLVRALALLPVDVAVAFVGRDISGHSFELLRLAEKLGIADRVALLGPQDDVAPYLLASHVLAQASWTEAFPIAPMEAMALRVPVVATAVGGTPELIGDAGVLVPPRSPTALADALRELLADEPRRLALGEDGYARLRLEFSAARMIDAVHHVYEESL